MVTRHRIAAGALGLVLALTACTGPPDAARCGGRLDVTPTVPSPVDRDATALLLVRRPAESTELLAYRFSEGTLVPLPGVPAGEAADLDVAPDGAKLALSVQPGRDLVLVTLATGAVESLGVQAVDPAWSPDGTTLAAVSPSGELLLISGDGSSVRRVAPSPDPGPLFAPSWSPDGRRLAVAADANPSSLGYDELHVIDVESGTALRIARGVSVDGPVWSPDGTRIAYHDFGGVRIACTDGGLAAKIADDGLYPVWSPDATEIALTSLGDGRGGLGIIVVPSAGGTGFRVTEGEDVVVEWIDEALLP